MYFMRPVCSRGMEPKNPTDLVVNIFQSVVDPPTIQPHHWYPVESFASLEVVCNMYVLKKHFSRRRRQSLSGVLLKPSSNNLVFVVVRWLIRVCSSYVCKNVCVHTWTCISGVCGKSNRLQICIQSTCLHPRLCCRETNPAFKLNFLCFWKEVLHFQGIS